MAWFDELNKKQKDAIGSDVKNVAVVAGPGTGKTRTLLHKACELIETEASKASGIRIANFTNAGVRDLRKKIVEETTYSAVDPKSATTFHSLAFGRLMYEDVPAIPKPVVVLDDWEERTFLDRFAKDKLTLANVRKAKKRRDDYNSRWCFAAEDVDEWLSKGERKAYEDVYTRAKDLLGFTTRGELTFLWWRLLNSKPGAKHGELGFPWPYFLVDEYQDLNDCEHEILRMLSESGVTIFAVGDPNQSIYEEMRHAHPELCWTFGERLKPGEVQVLDESYRCPRSVLIFGQALFTDPKGVPDPELSKTEGEAEILSFKTATEEVQGLTRLSSYLLKKNEAARVLLAVPDKRLAKKFVDALAERGITVEDRTKALSEDNDNCRLAKALLDLLETPSNAVAAATAIILNCAPSNRPTRVLELLDSAHSAGERIDKLLLSDGTLPPILNKARSAVRTSLEKLQTTDAPLKVLAEITGCDSAATTIEEASEQIATELYTEKQLVPGTVTIMTIHASKGMEAEYTMLPAAEPGLIERDFVGAAKEERRRLLYVGMTRAMEGLFVSYAATRSGPVQHSNPLTSSAKAGPSQFIMEIFDRAGYKPREAKSFLKERMAK